MSSRTLSQFPTGQQRYSINFDYLSRTFVEVSLLSTSSPDTNKVLKVGDDYRFLNATTIEVLAPQTGFDIIQIRRYTSTEPLVAFKDGSVLTATDLTIAELQSLHIAEEGRDQTTELSKMYADQAALSAGAASESLSHIIELGTSGYVPVGSFEGGGTVSLENQVLGYGSGLTLTHWRWDGGNLPKVVPAGSTPSSTGGVGAGRWIDVTDATLRGNLLSDNGSSLVNHKYSGTGAVKRSVADRLCDFLTVKDFGAKGDGIQDDTQAFQAAVDATPWGGTLIVPTPNSMYKISSAIIINKPIKIVGDGGSTVARKQMPCLKAVGHNDIFKLVPVLDGYRFDYGLTGVTIQDLMLEGPELYNNGYCGISVDETVNAGVFHIRENNFSGLHIRYFDFGIKLAGVVYLNSFYNVRALWCSTGCNIDKVEGSAEGGSDQNRFFGCEFVLNTRGLSLSELSFAGSQSIIGCTISENTTVGIVAGWNTTFYMSGSQIENNPIGVNFTIPASVGNPASEGSKTIVGNCFLFNGYDIWVQKSTTTLTGGFPFPLLITGNGFAQTKNKVLYVQAPTGPAEFDSRQFIFSSSNCYSGIDGKTGPVPFSMFTDGWKGYNGFKEDGKVTLNTAVTGDISKNVGFFNVPYGHQCYIKYNIVSVPTNASSGNTQTSAAINITNVNNPSSPVVIKSDFGREGEVFLSREDVGYGLNVMIAMNANDSTSTGIGVISYCII